MFLKKWRYIILCITLWIGCVCALGNDAQPMLPIVELTFDVLSRDTFSNGSFRLINDSDTVAMPMDIRHRGKTSAKYQKQSFAIKLKDSIGSKCDTTLLDLRKDNYWILDAMAPDKARMRNRIAMDLWMDFSSTPYYKEIEPQMQNGANGRFVEVYVNGAYNGIYCLMERVDRKQLKLKKAKKTTIQGVLYKSDNWTGSFFGQTYDDYTNTSAQWMRYDYQYPDVEDSLITWEPLYNAYYFVANSSSENFENEVQDYFDVSVFMDYDLFTFLLSARDNMGKNLYLSYYNIQQDQKLLITPWDMDHSFGRQYNGSIESPSTPTRMNTQFLYTRFASDISNYADNIIKRYAYLRKHAFDNDSLKDRFATYFQLFQSTGVATREMERWDGIDGITLDFEAEEPYIYQWIDERLAYMDSIFAYTGEEETPTSILQSTTTELTPKKIVHNGILYISYQGKIYTITGNKISNFKH